MVKFFAISSAMKGLILIEAVLTLNGKYRFFVIKVIMCSDMDQSGVD